MVRLSERSHYNTVPCEEPGSSSEHTDRQTFSRAAQSISVTWFAPCRCFQFGPVCGAGARKCTSLLLLPGCSGNNGDDSRSGGENRTLQEFCVQSSVYLLKRRRNKSTAQATGNWRATIKHGQKVSVTVLGCPDDHSLEG